MIFEEAIFILKKQHQNIILRKRILPYVTIRMYAIYLSGIISKVGYFLVIHMVGK